MHQDSGVGAFFRFNLFLILEFMLHCGYFGVLIETI